VNKANHAALNEALSARMTMSNAPQFLIRERRQLRQRSIVPAEILCTRGSFSEKTPVPMITLIASFCLWE